MAKVIMPLMSASVSGSFFKNLPFSQRATCQQVRFQRTQKDNATLAQLEQRARFKQAKEMWKLNDYGVVEFGFNLLGGKDVNLSSFPVEKRSPFFARFISDFMNFYN